MSDTTQHLEHEIEAHRAGVEQTLDKLKQRLSVDQVVTDMGQFLGVENVRETLNAAGRQVRENPMALALIGAGVAWLVMGRGSDAGSSRSEWRGDGTTGYRGASDDRWHSGDTGHHPMNPSSESLTDKARATVSDLGETLAEVPGKVQDAVGRATEGVQSTVDAAREKAASSVRPLTDRLAAQPLLVGAATVMVGAILGSALPRTRVEDRLLGPQRDRLVDAASRAGSDMGNRMADAALTTYDAAAAAARDEGLLPDGQSPTLAQKVERVANAAVDAAAAQVDPVLHGSDDGASRNEQSDHTDPFPENNETFGVQGTGSWSDTGAKAKRPRG